MLEVSQERRRQIFASRRWEIQSTKVSSQNLAVFEGAFSKGLEALLEELGKDTRTLSEDRREILRSEAWAHKWPFCQEVSLEKIAEIGFFAAFEYGLAFLNRRLRLQKA